MKITFQRFIFIVKTIHANHDSTEVPRLEKEIDRLVYKLYVCGVRHQN
jgi:hypothetical protein